MKFFLSIVTILAFISATFLLNGCYSDKHAEHQYYESDSLTTQVHIHSENDEVDKHTEHHQTLRASNGTQTLSPPKMAMADVGRTHVHIEYSAPSVRDRNIWGELVPYDQVWVSGAHMATTIEFENEMLFKGNVIEAGKYAFYTIPGREMWMVILNRNWDQHLADDYDPELDVLRLEIIPESTEFTEQLSYVVGGTSDGKGFIELKWEEVKIHIPIEER